MNDSRAFATIAPLLLALTLPIPTAGQDVLVGGRLGTTIYTFGGEGADGLDEYRTGIVAGLTLGYAPTDVLRVESGLSWVDKGAEGEVQGFEEPISADFRLSYLQVPLLLRLTPLPGHPFRPTLSAGPAVSFEVRCDMELDESVLAALVGCEDEGRERTDVGLLFGGGVAWTVGPAELLLEGQYELGLRDVDSVDALDTHHRGFMLVPRVSVAIGG